MHTFTNAPTVSVLDNIWGVVYFEEDGTVLCTDLLDATDYCDAADQAMDEADGGAFQLFEARDILGPFAPVKNQGLFGLRQS